MSLAENAAGRYRIIGRIAAGGMGEVYHAMMEMVGGVEKPVALKVVRPGLALSSGMEKLFVDEARVAMTLSHANIVTAFDVGRIDDRWFLAMEHVDGIDLAELVGICFRKVRQPIPHRHAILIAVEALKGLDYAHRKRSTTGKPLSIVHRDVSPGNLLISFEGEVKVADFGIAKSTLKDGASVAGQVKGKLPYMAPEQLEGQEVDPRADLYSLGAVLYEMLTGRPPVPDDDAASIPAILEGHFPKPRELTSDVTEALEAIVLRALRTDPRDRYPNAAAMRQDLERHAMQRDFLLSTTDLSDFVRTVVDEERQKLVTLRSGSTVRMNNISFAPTELAMPAQTPAPRDNDTGAAFDALLGAQLAPVSTDESFSVYRTAETPTVDAARTTPAAATGGAVAPRWSSERDEEEAGLPRASRGRLYAALGIALLSIGVMTGLGMLSETEPETSSDDRAEERDAAAEARPAGGGEETPTTAPELQPELEPVAEAQVEPAPEPSTARRRSTTRTSLSPGPPASGTGLLDINTNPWSTVFIDGQPIGTTPIQGHEVAAGRHRIRFDNPSISEPRTTVVDVTAGGHHRVIESLR